MVGKVLDVEHTLNPDQLAVDISNRFNEWDSYRQGKIEEWKELRNYLYATDTRTTSNSFLPWSNNTTTPKITQIMDNLHANYFAALFPNSQWMRWKGESLEDAGEGKRRLVESYLYHKMEKSDFVNTVSDLLYDYIQYGNCFAIVEYDRDYVEGADEEIDLRYAGPRLKRISPFDIVFNPTAVSFSKSPKIVKSVLTLGEIKKMVDKDPTNEYYAEVFDKMVGARNVVLSAGDVEKADGFVADGFSSIQHYYGSDYVEVLTFYGDIYDKEAEEYLGNRQITIVDRAYVLDNRKIDSWFGEAPIFHVGWRPRPDNLYAMGPLDNLVGLQYRIDHLENLKADVFDQIAYPVRVIRGDVEEFTWEPGAEIYVGEEGDVAYLAPDATALNADFQIDVLQNRMEELAGAPKQAMGIRTPGEKTAFEVQSLQNSASRIFEHKTAHFERVFIEPILNAMLEIGRRHMDTHEVVPSNKEDAVVQNFLDITKEDLMGKGRLVPMGARHFAERARRVQNLTQLMQIKNSDPTVAPHLSGRIQAKILAEELGEMEMYGENIAVKEQAKTQSAMADAEADMMEDMEIKAEQGF
jgi:hypothetical protein